MMASSGQDIQILGRAQNNENLQPTATLNGKSGLLKKHNVRCRFRYSFYKGHSREPKIIDALQRAFSPGMKSWSTVSTGQKNLDQRTRLSSM